MTKSMRRRQCYCVDLLNIRFLIQVLVLILTNIVWKSLGLPGRDETQVMLCWVMFTKLAESSHWSTPWVQYSDEVRKSEFFWPIRAQFPVVMYGYATVGLNNSNFVTLSEYWIPIWLSAMHTDKTSLP